MCNDTAARPSTGQLPKGQVTAEQCCSHICAVRLPHSGRLEMMVRPGYESPDEVTAQGALRQYISARRAWESYTGGHGFHYSMKPPAC
jgi:hypothetical protein